MNAQTRPGVTDPGTLGHALHWLARAFALAGGVVLFGLTLLSTVSILGRWLFAQPIPGDYEIAQLATAVAVSAFLPWCALRGGHVLVDFLTNGAPARVRNALDALGSLTIAAIGLLLGWRLTAGMIGLREAGETTMVLGIPIWYAYAPMIPSFLLLGAVAAHRAARQAHMAWTPGR
jgi:TRAP-type C4-dicarboxylate transport system permease small subunit